MLRNKGSRVWYDDQRNKTPPQDTGMRNEVVDAVKRKAPPQSKPESLFKTEPGGCLNLRQKGMVKKPRPQKGMLIQKIQRQVESWAKAPPIKGPVTDPIAHVRL